MSPLEELVTELEQSGPRASGDEPRLQNPLNRLF